jgi:hypothetical protein
MIPDVLLKRVDQAVRGLCAAKGYTKGPNWNPLAPKDAQQLQNVPADVDRIYLAEDVLDAASRLRFESEFVEFFQNLEE